MSENITRKVLAAGGIIATCGLLFVGAASAQGDIFSSILNNVKQIGSTASNLLTTSMNIANMVQQQVFPLQQINGIHGFVGSNIGRYRNYMNQVAGYNSISAQTPSVRSLEAVSLGGGGSLSSSFHSVFGTLNAIPSKQPQEVRDNVDANDAVAMGSIDLSSRVTASSQAAIQQANQIEDLAKTTAPGNADLLIAQALALQLENMAFTHQLMAAEIRAEASQLASKAQSKKLKIASLIGKL